MNYKKLGVLLLFIFFITNSHSENTESKVAISKNETTSNYYQVNLPVSSLAEVSLHSPQAYGYSKYAIKLNTLILLGVLSPSFEVKLGHNASFQIQMVGVSQPQGFIGTKKPISLFMCFVEPRIYPAEVYRGFFLGINAGFGLYSMSRQIIPNYWSEEFNGVDHKGWNAMGGVSLGWTFGVGANVAIEPFITTGYTYAKFDNYTNEKQRNTTPRTTNRFVYAYNGGINLVYKIDNNTPSHLRYSPVTKKYYGAKHNKRFHRNLHKRYRRR